MNSKEYKTLAQIVEQLEKCDYVTKDQMHDLKNNAAFIALKQMAVEDTEIREMLTKMRDESPLIDMEENTVENALKFILECDAKDEIGDKDWLETTVGSASRMVAYANKFLL